MPEASGDIREIVGQPVFVPLYKLFLTYGPVFRLSFGPKSFVVISDPAIVPSLHRKYIASMVTMFGHSTLHGMKTLEKAVVEKRPVEMENFFSRLTLDIIGKAVFNYDFDSLTHDDPFIQVISLSLLAAYKSHLRVMFAALSSRRFECQSFATIKAAV